MIRWQVTGIALAFCAGITACSKSPELQGDYPPVKLTERVYVIHGPNDLPTPANQGFINNPGFILTKKGVVVIDPGSSVQVGNMVLKAIASVTKDPVVAVFNTHIHGDHWLGNDAIHRAYPKAVIYAHPAMMRAAPTEGETWINLMNTLTENATRGTRAVIPTLAMEHEETLSLGGMRFRALHNGPAHTHGDLMIEVLDEKVLFTGDNVMVARVARFDDSDIKGILAACDLALSTQATHIVPGHGPSGGPDVIRKHRAWINKFYTTTKRLYDEGVSEIDAKERLLSELKEYSGWNNFDKDIGKAISIVWLQVEKEAF